jgi:integrase/recombinase XerD
MGNEITVRNSAVPAKSDPLRSFGRDLSPLTRRAYQNDLAEFFDFIGMNPRTGNLHTVTPAHVAEFVAHVSKRDASGNLTNAATVARKLSSVRAAFRWLRACGAMATNPAELVKGPRVSTQSPRQGLTKAEVRSLVDAVTGDSLKAKRDRAILWVMLYGGLRRAEVAGLRVADLYRDDPHHVLHVRGKGNKVRSVPLRAEAVTAIRTYLDARGGTDAADAPLFRPTMNNRTGKTDKPMSPALVWQVVTKYATAAGIAKRVSPHSLRHTAITTALDSGAKLERVQAFAGHADPKTTIRYHRTREDLNQSAAHFIAY